MSVADESNLLLSAMFSFKLPDVTYLQQCLKEHPVRIRQLLATNVGEDQKFGAQVIESALVLPTPNELDDETVADIAMATSSLQMSDEPSNVIVKFPVFEDSKVLRIFFNVIELQEDGTWSAVHVHDAELDYHFAANIKEAFPQDVELHRLVDEALQNKYVELPQFAKEEMMYALTNPGLQRIN